MTKAAPNKSLEGTNLAVGAALIIAPFVLGFASNTAALWVHMPIGAMVAVLAGVQLFKGRNKETARIG
ncbi:MAG TPA: SPW repeat protein [Kaistia sp.]|jgi:CDP-diglyceride synthetase|nr:SPW repeat protein [Kaistia sp.]